MGCGASKGDVAPAPVDPTASKAGTGNRPIGEAGRKPSGRQRSRTGLRPEKVSAKAPPPSFAALIAAGTVVPDERDGPYALSSYHANITGKGRGYIKADAAWEEWVATRK